MRTNQKKSYYNFTRFTQNEYRNKGNILIGIEEVCKKLVEEATRIGVKICTSCGVMVF